MKGRRASIGLCQTKAKMVHVAPGLAIVLFGMVFPSYVAATNLQLAERAHFLLWYLAEGATTADERAAVASKR